MRIAIAQPEMHGSIEENVAQVGPFLVRGAECGADFVVFPELTLTGLHTKRPRLLRVELEQELGAAARHLLRPGLGKAWISSTPKSPLHPTPAEPNTR